jgi:competence protein ComEA
MKSAVAIVILLTMVVGFAISAGAVGQININTASKEELMQLEGVGSSYAQKIIDYREANGPFENPEDITNVKGIGDATYEKNRDRITVGTKEAD